MVGSAAMIAVPLAPNISIARQAASSVKRERGFATAA